MADLFDIADLFSETRESEMPSHQMQAFHTTSVDTLTMNATNATRISSLKSQILKAKHLYYRGEPELSDLEYDSLEDELRRLAPNDEVLALVGAPVSPDSILTKATHSIPMGSQSKVNSKVEFMAWAHKNGVKRLHASLKADGASAAVYYQNGRIIQAISRGDGLIGEDITANCIQFKGIPAWIDAGGRGFTGAVRFEAILTVADWAIVDPAMSKNPRNSGTGIMSRKNGFQSNLLTAFAFDIDEIVDGKSIEFASEEQKCARLSELGFRVIEHQVCASVEEVVDFFERTKVDRPELAYWIDGVVVKADSIALQKELGVVSSCPRGQIAWKFDSVGVETELLSVVISGGHTGALIPTANFSPVTIGGTTVSAASLANFDEIARLDLAIGDKILVTKANDIIPKVVRVLERPVGRTPINVPCTCPFCGGEVGRRVTTDGEAGAITECKNPDCNKKTSGKVRRWIASLDILGIGDSVLDALMDRLEVEDAADLYTLNRRPEALGNLVINVDKDLTLGQKRASSILDAIDAKRSLNLSEFLGSLGIEHLGKRRVVLMAKAAAGDLDTLQDWRSGKLRDAAIAEKAGAPNIASQIQNGIDAMGAVIDKLLEAGVTASALATNHPSDSQLKTVCISGKLLSGKKKSDYDTPLKLAGYALVDDVSKGLTFLVLADPESTSGKSSKARKLGIEVISEDRLLELISQA